MVRSFPGISETLARLRADRVPMAVVTSKRELGPLVAAAMESRAIPEAPVNTGWRGDLLRGIIDNDALLPAEDEAGS